MTKIKAGFPDEKAFREQLAKDDMDLPGITTIVRHAMVIDKYVKSEVAAKVRVNPEEEAKFYEENKEKMKRPEAVRASHILLRAQKDAPAARKQAAKAKAEEVDARAKKGDDFAALAKEFSQDPGSAKNGGDLGFFSKGQMVPDFEKAAWGLKKGEVSDIVQTEYGFHVIKVTDRRAEGYAPLEEVRPQIKEYLTMQMTQQDLQKAGPDPARCRQGRRHPLDPSADRALSHALQGDEQFLFVLLRWLRAGQASGRGRAVARDQPGSRPSVRRHSTFEASSGCSRRSAAGGQSDRMA